MLVYPIADSGQVLEFSNAVLRRFSRHRQRRWYQREAGGQLFARFSETKILVEEATGPRRTDVRTRTSYVPDRKAEQREIDTRHAAGLHYIGDWHTHPESVPVPSWRDKHSIAESVRKSTHTLQGFVLVVVGQMKAPAGLAVSVYDAAGGRLALEEIARIEADSERA